MATKIVCSSRRSPRRGVALPRMERRVMDARASQANGGNRDGPAQQVNEAVLRTGHRGGGGPPRPAPGGRLRRVVPGAGPVTRGSVQGHSDPSHPHFGPICTSRRHCSCRHLLGKGFVNFSQPAPGAHQAATSATLDGVLRHPRRGVVVLGRDEAASIDFLTVAPRSGTAQGDSNFRHCVAISLSILVRRVCQRHRRTISKYSGRPQAGNIRHVTMARAAAVPGGHVEVEDHGGPSSPPANAVARVSLSPSL